MKTVIGTLLVLALGAGAGAWFKARPVRRPAAISHAVGTRPGGVLPGQELLQPAPGDSLVGFSSGCFWGSEEALRKMPGIVATAVGYTGGSLPNPTYEQAHQTGHLETVLVEFDPRRTPFAQLLKTFWTLPRSMSKAPASPSSPYRAAIWTYGSQEQALAEASREALERKLHRKVGVEILPARPFYLAEEYHQQFDEKSGKELCPAIP